MKPIHKFNNGRGATLCHNCSKIITERLTTALYCSSECAIKAYNEQMEKEVHKNRSNLNK